MLHLFFLHLIYQSCEYVPVCVLCSFVVCPCPFVRDFSSCSTSSPAFALLMWEERRALWQVLLSFSLQRTTSVAAYRWARRGLCTLATDRPIAARRCSLCWNKRNCTEHTNGTPFFATRNRKTVDIDTTVDTTPEPSARVSSRRFTCLKSGGRQIKACSHIHQHTA